MKNLKTFEFFTAVKMRIVIWVLAPYSLVKRYQHRTTQRQRRYVSLKAATNLHSHNPLEA